MNPQHAANFIETIQLDAGSEWKSLRVRYENFRVLRFLSCALSRKTCSVRWVLRNVRIQLRIGEALSQVFKNAGCKRVSVEINRAVPRGDVWPGEQSHKKRDRAEHSDVQWRDVGTILIIKEQLK